MKNLILCAFIVLISQVSTAYAMKMQSIYAAEVRVASQNDSLRDQAIQQALAQTLTKVSGSSTILDNPVIKTGLLNAKNSVQEWGYMPSGISSMPFFLKVQFDPHAVKQLLRQAKAPIWEANRPLIIVWLVVKKGVFRSEIIDSGSNNEFAVLLKSNAFQRGLPILFPMMDVTDLAQVSIDDAHSMLTASIQKGTERYHADAILIGNMERDGKMIRSHWKLLLQKDQWNWDIDNESATLLIQMLVDKINSTLVERYTTVPSDVSALSSSLSVPSATVSTAAVPAVSSIAPTAAVSSPSSFIIVVNGVTQPEDFENVMRFMKQIVQIKELEIENISGDQIIFHLMVRGTQKTFMQDMSLGQHLQLQLEKENELTYLWVR